MIYYSCTASDIIVIYMCVGGLSDLGAVFVQETFERAKAWVKELQRQASPNIVIALAGNKADLAEKRLVEYEVTHSCPLLLCGL